MEITLYHSPGACSMAVYISLIEAGADFEVKIISLKDGEHKDPEYTALNPKQKVPYLVVDGKGLSENVAIQHWIATTFPQANLIPSDSWEHCKALSLMGWFGSAIHPHITRHFRTGLFCTVEGSHADIKQKAKAMYMDQMALVNAELAHRTWFFDHYTVCDAYFFWIYNRALNEQFELDTFEHSTAHYNRMLERESVKKVLAHLHG